MSVIRVGLPGGRSIVVGHPAGPLVDVSELTLEDLARGLARIFRFAGQTDYTVAQHSVALSRCFPADPVLRTAALLHDAPEAMGVGDVNTHLKTEYGSGLKGLELVMFDAVWEKFGAYRVYAQSVVNRIDEYDKLMGAAEAVHFGFGHTVQLALPPGWHGWKPAAVWTPNEAQHNWLEAVTACRRTLSATGR